MVDGRDLAAVDDMLSNVLVAGAFADPKVRSLLGMTDDGKRVVIELEQGHYEWSNPAAGGVFPVKPIKFIYVDKDPDPRIEFCGFSASDSTLIAMDGRRNVLERYILTDAKVHP